MRVDKVRFGLGRRAIRVRAVEAEPAHRDEPEPRVPAVGPAHRVQAGAVDEPVDLLNPEPAAIVEGDQLRRTLSFAFAGGDTTGAIRGALRRAPVAASDWDPASFAPAVFVPDLLRTCMAVNVMGLAPELDEVFLTRLLTRPPREPEVVEHRRKILRELAEEPEVRSRFRETYRALHRLRALLEPEAQLLELDDARRRLETLGAVRDAFESMASGFSSCTSGLRRISELGERARAAEPYARLLALLDYDNHLAGVALQLRIGADGRIRRFDIREVAENRQNRFYQSPLGRLLTRLSLFLRGYFFTEGELVNRWVDSVFEGLEPLLPPLFQLLGEMELYLAALAFKETAEERGLAVCFADLDGIGGEEGEPAVVTIEGLWNPLLLGQVPRPVPCDLRSEGWRGITVVTGPNSGGKTRLLQGIAIAQMLAQCGLFAPARAARLGRASGLFVSLVQEAAANQAEGRLGTELLRIRELFEKARPGTLILLDELCSGTNPSEGEEIFRLVVSLLPELRPRAYITTHFLQFAARLEAEATGMAFIQVELEDDSPTFRFREGVAATSLAQQTAARLGVTRDELLALVRRHREPAS